MLVNTNGLAAVVSRGRGDGDTIFTLGEIHFLYHSLTPARTGDEEERQRSGDGPSLGQSAGRAFKYARGSLRLDGGCSRRKGQGWLRWIVGFEQEIVQTAESGPSLSVMEWVEWPQAFTEQLSLGLSFMVFGDSTV